MITMMAFGHDIDIIELSLHSTSLKRYSLLGFYVGGDCLAGGVSLLTTT